MGILVMALLASILSGGMKAEGSLYPETMLVTNVSESEIVMECSNGNIFFMSSEDYEDIVEGDMMSVILYDNGTPKVNDDVIIDAKYSGYLELFENIEGRYEWNY